MIYDNNYLSKLLDTHGVDKLVEMVDIDKIECPTIQIICRTIKHSKEVLIRELNGRSKK